MARPGRSGYAAAMDDLRSRLRTRRPLVHCLTNPVAAPLTANALLCLGASPLMAEAAEEMAETAAFTDAILVNLGMQTPARMDAARLAIGSGKPWVLDPVAAGAMPRRLALAREFAAAGPALIKGNASEIRALAGAGAGGRGTDATEDAEAVIEPARALARQTGAIIVVTGATDWITNGSADRAIRHGHPMMAQISGMGCVAGAVLAAAIAAGANPAEALVLLGRAGEHAAARCAGPGSFVTAFLDALAGAGA